jgi:hypothetical protein
MLKDLCPEKAMIFRIVHRDNVPWIIQHGLHCRNSAVVAANYIQIGNPDLIERRRQRIVPAPPAGMLSDYVPFYFTPFSPMFYNIKTGYRGIQQRANEEIVIFVTSIYVLVQKNITFLYSDRHASLAAAEFSPDARLLQERIDWVLLQRRDFSRSAEDPGKVERYEAETLVHKHVPIEAITDIFCYDDSTVEKLGPHIRERVGLPRISKQRAWYF